MPDPVQILYDPRNGDAALTVVTLEAVPGQRHPARTNCFVVHHVRAGNGAFWADDARHSFVAPCLLFFSPYQLACFDPVDSVLGTSVHFHANFLCIETYHHEVGCNGVLFNDPYGVPTVTLDQSADEEVAALIEQIRRELGEANVAHTEVLVAYLKILLVRATRLKREQQALAGDLAMRRLPPVLDELRELIETNYRSLHAPADYADRLHMTSKALGRLVKDHLGKTLTELIRDRVLKHAKWELLHTLRSVKEIARELGYDDELYFSRLFKKATGYSPQHFREFETAIREGRNLSMSSRPPSILQGQIPGQNAGTSA